MKHVEFSLRRPVTITMIFAALAGIGALCARLLPLEFLPDIEIPVMVVVIPYENSTPREIERLITRPVEESLATLTDLKRMRSTSGENQSQIVLFFDWKKDMPAAGIEARGKVDAIQHRLPQDLRRTQVFTMSTSDEPVVTLRVSSALDLSNAYNMLDRSVKRRLERLPGVSKVELQGVDAKEVRILLDSARVAAHGVDLNALRERLAKSNFAVNGGQVTTGASRMSLRPRGEFGSLEELRELVVNETGLRLGDLGQVELRSPDRNYGRRLDGTYAISINVFKSTGANMVEVADRVLEEITAIGELPEMRGLRLFELNNRANSVRQSLSDLLQAGLIGALLAIAVLYAFLRQWSTTLIVTLSVPFSLLVTLAVLYFSGLTLNILTMMGLMLAVGMLVDNSVVVTESIFRHRQSSSDSAPVATVRGMREVGIAVIAGTATTVAVYVPIGWGDQNEITIFMRSVGLTITVAVLMSLCVSQTLIPMLASRIATPPPSRSGTLSKLSDRYRNALSWCLLHRWKTAIGTIALLGSVMIPGTIVDQEMNPEEPGRRLSLQYHLNGIYPLHRVEQAVDQVEGFLLKHKQEFDIRNVYSYWNEGRAESTILLHEGDAMRENTDDVIQAIQDGVPEIVIGKPAFRINRRGNNEGFSVRLVGESTDQLVGVGYDVLALLDRLALFDSLTWDMIAGTKEAQVKVDGERAAVAGLTAEAIARSIETAMKGDFLRDFRTLDGDTQVRVAFRDDDRQTLQDLANMPLYTPGGQRITLASVADINVQRGPRRVQRIDQRTSATITGDLKPGETLKELKPVVKQILDNYAFPPGVSWQYGRGFDQEDATQKSLLLVIFLGVALIYLVMAAIFESTIHPISIIVSIAFSVVGVFWTFLITGTVFSMMAYIGILILMGVVVNNGIVLVDYINTLRKQGMDRDQAIIEAGGTRLRPILMTVATTVIGLLPLAVGSTKIGGEGPPYFPMARAIMGGLLFSTAISLLVVPYLYALLDDLVAWSRRVASIARGTTSAKSAS